VYDTNFKVLIHYQKIDKYKRKYQYNIFVGKLPTDFTDGNVQSVFTEGITVGKTIIKKKKKTDDVSFLPTKFIPLVNSLVNCEHCSSCQLQRESPTENSVRLKSSRYYLAVF
jgi:hypothetical protein